MIFLFVSLADIGIIYYETFVENYRYIIICEFVSVFFVFYFTNYKIKKCNDTNKFCLFEEQEE
jgi:hypothetical protein